MDESRERAIKDKIKNTCSTIINKLQEPAFRKGNSDELVDIFQSTILLASLQRFSKAVEPQLEELLFTLNKCDETLKKYREAFFLTVRFKRYQFEKLCYTLNAQTDYLKNLLQVMKSSDGKDFAKEIREDTGKSFWASFAQDKLLVEWQIFVNQLRARFSKEFTLAKIEEQLMICLDPSRTGYVSAYKFSEFLKQFGPFNSCLTKMNHILSQSYFCGYLSSREANHLLYNKPAGTFLVRFSLSAPGAFAIELVKASIMEPEHNLIKSNDQESSYDVLTKYMTGNQFRKGADCSFVHQLWYFGDISRSEAEETLMGAKKGTFLVYNHAQIQAQYVAAYVSHSGHTLHVDITPQPSGGYKIGLPSHDMVYPGLSEMVGSLGVIFVKPADVSSLRTSSKPEVETEYSNLKSFAKAEPAKTSTRPASTMIPSRADTVFQPMPTPASLGTSAPLFKTSNVGLVRESNYGAMPTELSENPYSDMPTVRAQAQQTQANQRGSVVYKTPMSSSDSKTGTVGKSASSSSSGKSSAPELQTMYSPMGHPTQTPPQPQPQPTVKGQNHYDSIPTELQHEEWLKKKQSAPKRDDNYAAFPGDFAKQDSTFYESISSAESKILQEYSDLPSLQSEVLQEERKIEALRTTPPTGRENYDQIPVYSKSSSENNAKIAKCIITQLDNNALIIAGTATTNAKGKAEISIPSINLSPNAIISYSVTCIGKFSNTLVESELKNNTFVISAAADQKFSWQLFISSE